MSSNPPSRAELLQALHREGRQFSTATVLFHQAIAERLGLSATDHKAADILTRTGPITAGELAERTGLTTGAITGIVDRLEQAGWVRRERDPHDRRRVMIELINDSERECNVQQLFEPFTRAWTELCESYSDHDLALILDFMSRTRAVVAEQGMTLRQRK